MKGILSHMVKIVDSFVWLPLQEPTILIKSPRGKTIIRTDIKTARRIIKKHGWNHVDLQPCVNRKDALKILIMGNKKYPILHYSYIDHTMRLVGK